MGNKTDGKSSSAEFRRLLGSAEFGIASAQRELGEWYRAGKGTDEERAEAVNCFKKAAKRGIREAQYNLAYYYDGLQKYAKAVKWYKCAAEKGVADAMCGLGDCYMWAVSYTHLTLPTKRIV